MTDLATYGIDLARECQPLTAEQIEAAARIFAVIEDRAA